MMDLSQITIKSLQNAGWFPGRVVDFEPYFEAFQAKNVAPFPTVRKVLEEFGDLRIVTIPRTRSNPFRDFNFDAVQAIQNSNAGTILYYEQRTKEKLCVVGEAAGSHMVLCLDSLGRIYAGYDELLLLAGKDFASSLNNMCEERELKEVPDE